MRSLCITTKCSPCSPQLEDAHEKPNRPSAAKKKKQKSTTVIWAKKAAIQQHWGLYNWRVIINTWTDTVPGLTRFSQQLSPFCRCMKQAGVRLSPLSRAMPLVPRLGFEPSHPGLRVPARGPCPQSMMLIHSLFSVGRIYSECGMSPASVKLG